MKSVASALPPSAPVLRKKPAAADAGPRRTAALPRFAQIKARLRQDILDKRLLPEQKLPSEAQLQVAFGVSRITIRQALAELQAEGLIHTINGKGSFVTRPAGAPRLGMLAGFNDMVRLRGRVPSGRLLSARNGPAPARVVQALRLERDTSVTVVRALRLIDGVPASIVHAYYEPTLGRDVLAQRIHEDDAMTLLEEVLGMRLDHTQIAATAVRAGRVRGALLGVPSDAPLLQMRFVPYDLTGTPLLYSDVYFRPDQFSYRAVVRR